MIVTRDPKSVLGCCGKDLQTGWLSYNASPFSYHLVARGPDQVWQGHCLAPAGTPPHPSPRAVPAGLGLGCSLCPSPRAASLCVSSCFSKVTSSGPTLNAGCWDLEALNYFHLQRPYSK